MWCWTRSFWMSAGILIGYTSLQGSREGVEDGRGQRDENEEEDGKDDDGPVRSQSTTRPFVTVSLRRSVEFSAILSEVEKWEEVKK
jgi:hypothetical protein